MVAMIKAKGPSIERRNPRLMPRQMKRIINSNITRSVIMMLMFGDKADLDNKINKDKYKIHNGNKKNNFDHHRKM